MFAANVRSDVASSTEISSAVGYPIDHRQAARIRYEAEWQCSVPRFHEAKLAPLSAEVLHSLRLPRDAAQMFNFAVPSTNQLYVPVKINNHARIVPSAKMKEFSNKFDLLLHGYRRDTPVNARRVEVWLVNHRIDIDNAVKPVLDRLVAMGVMKDDRYVRKLDLYKIHAKEHPGQGFIVKLWYVDQPVTSTSIGVGETPLASSPEEPSKLS